MQPEDVAEQRKASGVARTCSSTAEDVAVQRMPSGLGETLQNVAGWRWKSRQPGDAVRRQAEDGTMVGGSAEDTLEGGGHIGRQRTHLGGGGYIWSRGRVRDGRHKGFSPYNYPPSRKASPRCERVKPTGTYPPCQLKLVALLLFGVIPRFPVPIIKGS